MYKKQKKVHKASLETQNDKNIASIERASWLKHFGGTGVQLLQTRNKTRTLWGKIRKNNLNKNIKEQEL